jgi:hypothetical protein
MRAYLNQMPAAAWVGLGLPALLLAYALLTLLGPEILRALVPETVRALFRII